MMNDCHELGQGWIPEDGIVRQADVCDVKVDELGAVVLALPEGDMQADLLGNVVISKNFLRTRKIMLMHSNKRGECCLRTPVDRSGIVDAT